MPKQGDETIKKRHAFIRPCSAGNLRAWNMMRHQTRAHHLPPYQPGNLAEVIKQIHSQSLTEAFL